MKRKRLTTEKKIWILRDFAYLETATIACLLLVESGKRFFLSRTAGKEHRASVRPSVPTALCRH
jgi:hypothetical protein